MDGYDLAPLIARLRELAEPDYAAFTRRLVPDTVCEILGVRVPALRAMAREILRGDWRGFLGATRDHPIHELRLMHGMALGGARCPVDEKLALTDAFLPFIDNWAVCDGFCSSFKPRPKEMDGVFDFAMACAMSDIEYRKRFGLVMLMNRFHEPPYIEGALRAYRGFRHEGYYARMAAAWGLATLWPFAREDCLSILREGLWDDFTHNRAIQKLCESYRVTDADKALARSLRRRKERA